MGQGLNDPQEVCWMQFGAAQCFRQPEVEQAGASQFFDQGRRQRSVAVDRVADIENVGPQVNGGSQQRFAFAHRVPS